VFFRNSKPTAQHYQHYANINPHTCESCLLRHGTVFARLVDAPPHHPGCRCAYLPLSADALKSDRQRAERMRAKARAELQRRALFQQALGCMGHDTERALACLRGSVAIDVYVEELELLHAQHGRVIQNDAALTTTLRKLFVSAHFNKMDQAKYRLISEGMYGQLEAWGRQRIQALFADPEQP